MKKREFECQAFLFRHLGVIRSEKEIEISYFLDNIANLPTLGLNLANFLGR